MYVHRRRKRIEIWTPAKLNLYLEVLGRRADGYHELETLMVPIDLFDTLRMAPRDDGQIILSAHWARPRISRGASFDSAGDLPLPEQNLVYRAVTLLARRTGIRSGLDLMLIKRIPAAAGLGGGSSDAAAALWGANLLWRLNWSLDQLAEIAAELGSDIPFFLYGSAAYCRGRGERVEPLKFPSRPQFVILRPPQGLSTAAVYARMNRGGAPDRRVDRSQCHWLRNPLDLAQGMFNRLQSAALEVAPWMQRVQDQFNRLDLLGHQMSGSGSAYFGVCRDAGHARRLAALLRSRCAGQVFCASVVGGQHRVLPVSQN